MDASSKERDYLRNLAQQVAEIAASPENEQIKKRWRDVNGLRKPDRAPVYCRPMGCWDELIPTDSFFCSDPWLRDVEFYLKRVIVKHEIGDDDPVDAYYPVDAKFDCDPPNIWGVDIIHERPEEAEGAWAYNPPLKTESDFEKLRIPRFTYNKDLTEEEMSRIDDLFGDILPPKMECGPPISSIIGTHVANLRGLTEMMMDTIAEPELLHRLTAYVRDCVLESMKQIEETGLLTPNNNKPMMCSDWVGPEPVNGKITYKNLWVHTNSQEYDQVSPAMWEEFCLQYQMPILEKYGLVQYGCCENLTHKMEGVLSIPNLRIFVCSAWTNLDKLIERVNNNYVIMWRQKATDVVFPEDLEVIKRDLDEGARKLQGSYYQIVLRELQTLCGHSTRLHDWTRLAKEAAEKYA